MKNVSTKVIGAVAVLGIAGAVFAFKADNTTEGPAYKKYEVIRMVDGEMTEFDTLVAENSNYSPDDYLNDLGFGDDEHISIIDLSNFSPMSPEGHGGNVFVMDGKNGDGHGEHDKRVVKIEVSDDEDIQHKGDGEHEIIIEKRVTKSINGDEEDVDVDIDVQGILDDINIDSIIEVAMQMHGEGDSGAVVMQKMIVMDSDGEMPEGMTWEVVDHEGADYHKEVHGDNHHMEIAVWGDEHEDFTLVVVSDADASGNKTPITTGKESTVEFKLFPNPATTTAQLQLDIEEKAMTEIVVTDIKGKSIMKLNIGEFQGPFTHDFDVTKWAKGVYFVHVESGDEKLIEKLIVE